MIELNGLIKPVETKTFSLAEEKAAWAYLKDAGPVSSYDEKGKSKDEIPIGGLGFLFVIALTSKALAGVIPYGRSEVSTLTADDVHAVIYRLGVRPIIAPQTGPSSAHGGQGTGPVSAPAIDIALADTCAKPGPRGRHHQPQALASGSRRLIA